MTGDATAPEMCMDVAPGQFAPRKDAAGMFRVPWCHLPKGHEGPHRCGSAVWGWPSIPSRVTKEDCAMLVDVNRQIAEARALRMRILAKYGLDDEGEA
jgi:hypothetical protein